jgi:integrase/recombinase XerC
MKTISETIKTYIEDIAKSRSQETAHAYNSGLNYFLKTLDIDPDKSSPSELTTDHFKKFLDKVKKLSVKGEALYVYSVKSFYRYLSIEEMNDANMAKIEVLVRYRQRKSKPSLPSFPKDDIAKVIEYMMTVTENLFDSEEERLRSYRDRALIITLADTGLRIHEVCKMKRGDLDMNQGVSLVTGKGSKEAIVRFSSRSVAVIKEYLRVRSKLDGATGKPLRSLPLLARHDRGTGSRLDSITTTTGRNIVKERVKEAIGEPSTGEITPHSFRHYFVSKIVDETGNIHLAKRLARHENIQITQLYAHLSDKELDDGYAKIFEKE